jgi:hypothetical protein
MSTWYQDNKKILEERPYYGRPSWELKNMAKALSFFPWMNTSEDSKRKEQVEIELKLRRVK